jgi:undecaprenyl-diphosphatase
MDRRFAFVATWTVALVGFVAVAALASAHDSFPGDVWLAQRFQELDSAVVSFVLDVPEELSDSPLIFAIWAGATILVLATIGWRQALLLLAAFVLRFSNSQLKEIVERPRPSLDLVSAEHQPASLSFPSGHAQSVVLLYGLLFYFATVYIKDRAWRTVAQVFCGWVVISVGLERVYVGDHWPSDVVGGFWFGGLALAVLIAIDQLVFRRGMDEGQTGEGREASGGATA